MDYTPENSTYEERRNILYRMMHPQCWEDHGNQVTFGEEDGTTDERKKEIIGFYRMLGVPFDKLPFQNWIDELYPEDREANKRVVSLFKAYMNQQHEDMVKAILGGERGARNN